jgi:hypothetical protein
MAPTDRCGRSGLLTSTLQRLGAGASGIGGIKKHGWFGKLDWQKVADGALQFPQVSTPQYP